MIKLLSSKIKNMIKRAVSTLDCDTKNNITRTQVSYMGKTKQIEVYLPYGISANIPNNSDYILLNIQGQEENVVGLGHYIEGKIKNLNVGEIVIQNPIAGTKIYLKSDGSIDIIATSGINLGLSGKAIARKDDAVTGQIIIPGGSSAGTYNLTNGKISTGSSNNTSN